MAVTLVCEVFWVFILNLCLLWQSSSPSHVFKLLPHVWNFYFKPAFISFTEVISSMPAIALHGHSLTSAPSLCLSPNRKLLFAEVCITLHFSPPELFCFHRCNRLHAFCWNIPVISKRQAWKRIYRDLCSTCWEDVIELSCSSLLF